MRSASQSLGLVLLGLIGGAYAVTSVAHAAGEPARIPDALVVVVTSSRVEAYDEALRGLRDELGREVRLAVVDLDERTSSLSTELNRLRPRLVVAIGSGAARAAVEAATEVPFLATMVVRSQGSTLLNAAQSQHKAIGVVLLDLPFETVLREIGAVFPGKNRIGVIYSRASSGLEESALQAVAVRHGFTLTSVNAHGPGDVVEALVSLKRSVDIVWCPPDGNLFNATTVKPLVLASLRHQMLITGFSEGFVRAGTAMGVYPDFEAIGRQTATAVRDYLNQGAPPGEQTAGTAHVAINERILHLLGVEWTSPTDQQARLTVLK